MFFSDLGNGSWLLNWTRNVQELRYEMDEELNLQTDWLTDYKEILDLSFS